eukprot:TRINITY_DN17190_c0_g1_i1.p1 TRINITY_DN17190_c0_g1~~TRINITY_DN17190_c0_g1_i1.p1  ORF type:complete len:213 (-),score=55.57 TRINITY_DN17190_c0_g1_i1:158-796(-)
MFSSKAIFTARAGSSQLFSLTRHMGTATKTLLKRDFRVAATAANMIESKKTLLKQIRDANPGHYTSVDHLVGASIGAHMRHSMQHFAKLLAGIPQAPGQEGLPIHYDRRERHNDVETSIDAALAALDGLTDAVVKLDADSMKAKITPEFMLEVKGLEHKFNSTVERELFFCVHHAVHHMAMIALILKNIGGYDDEIAQLGRAPSTQYEDRRS